MDKGGTICTDLDITHPNQMCQVFPFILHLVNSVSRTNFLIQKYWEKSKLFIEWKMGKTSNANINIF